MKRGVTVLLSTMLVALVGFQAGRHSARTVNRAVDRDKSADGDRISSNLTPEEATQNNVAAIRIENIGQVGFEQAFNLLRSATPETLRKWTIRLEGLPSGPRKAAAISAFFKTLVQFDARTAVKMASLLNRRQARISAFKAIIDAAPAASLAEVGRLFTTVETGGVPFEFIMNWSRSDPVGASEFMETNGVRTDVNAIAELLSNWAAMDPEAARGWFDRLEPSKQDARAFEGLYDGWSERDRNSALQDLIAHGAEKNRRRAIKKAAAALFAESPGAAGSFVAALPAGRARNAAVDEIAAYATRRRITEDETEFPPESVAKWMLTLPEDAWAEHLGYVVSAWGERDAAAVGGWLDTLPGHLHDQVASKFCLAFNWDSPQRNFEAGLRIKNRSLREDTLRAMLAMTGTRERAREMIKHATLPARERAVLEQIASTL